METMSAFAVPVISLILAATVPMVIYYGYLNRKGSDGTATKGIGWQFIRYTVIAIALPIAGILALNDALSSAAATIIAGALGYAFGQTSKAGD